MIYVDDLQDRGWRYGPNCHLLSDDLSETGLTHLHLFAAAIGLQRRYFQAGSYPHYDLNKRLRTLAIAYGATAVSCKEIVRVMQIGRQKLSGAA